MSKQLEQALISIKAMPYYKNDSSRSGKTFNGHEAAISYRLVKAGFKEVTKDVIPSLTKEVASEWIASEFEPKTFLLERTDKEHKRKPELTKRFKIMPLGSFICQPGGSHSFPDFLIRDFDGRFIGLEAKSSESALSPMWNDNLPKKGAIYVWSTEKSNQTTIALGQDIIGDEIIELRKAMSAELELIYEKYKPLTADADYTNRGWEIAYRPQNFQLGGAEKTDWFTHADRVKCEKNALKFALGK